jgi:uncharacterized protein YlaI
MIRVFIYRDCLDQVSFDTDERLQTVRSSAYAVQMDSGLSLQFGHHREF